MTTTDKITPEILADALEVYSSTGNNSITFYQRKFKLTYDASQDLQKQVLALHLKRHIAKLDWKHIKDGDPPENEKLLCINAKGHDGPEMISLKWNKALGWHIDSLGDEYKALRFDHITYYAKAPAVPDDWYK